MELKSLEASGAAYNLQRVCQLVCTCNFASKAEWQAAPVTGCPSKCMAVPHHAVTQVIGQKLKALTALTYLAVVGDTRLLMTA